MSAMTKPRILIIEDERALTDVLSYNLQREGYEPIVANDGQEGLRKAQTLLPDAVLLDLMLPVRNGLEVCRELRSGDRTRTMPIIMLTAKAEETDQVVGFSLGADDYVTKPFSIQELLARVRAHLRRAPERATSAIEAGDFVVDESGHTVTVQGKPVHLTPKEFELLLHLARNAGKVMTHRALLTAVWGAQSAHQPEYLRVFVGQLRKKLEGETGRQYIQTEPWVGYRFVPEGWVGTEE